MAITKDQVVNAYFELEITGKPTSLRAIREFIGGGSLTMISDHLKSINQSDENDDNHFNDTRCSMTDRIIKLEAEIKSLKNTNARLEEIEQSMKAIKIAHFDNIFGKRVIESEKPPVISELDII